MDTFVSEHRKRASLEKLRDDLVVHLKFLRSSMIKLINKDYADFVNLSANLVSADGYVFDDRVLRRTSCTSPTVDLF